MIRPFNRARNVGIDLGTANTLIYIAGKGTVLSEPSVVAIDLNTGKLVEAGQEAHRMLGRTPGDIRTVRPLRDGVIADFDAAELMIKSFIEKGNEGRRLMAPRLVVGIPSGVTGVERRALRDAALVGAREVYLIDEPMAAAIGAGLPVTEPVGTMIVDIGGGTTEVAVISLCGVVTCESLRVAGDEFDDAIRRYMKKVHGLLIGERTAEEAKVCLASAFPGDENEALTLEIRGLHLASALPRTVTISSVEIREALGESLAMIVDLIKRTLERTPPELASDIAQRGIMLAGGGARLKGISDLVAHETGIPAHLAENPLECVVLGCARVLEDYGRLSRVLDTQISG
ncbi:MAG: rod shape-determining protein [Synechococcus sp. SB0668_bin_15]|nr:rod shape-determining protein [Synechococcus sp. SB0668_bin_15]MXZ83815.1 rod shape-determining protein [Synechococcus sp. SB0666_bin_14]MYA91435.1 rod shape-determining protein [Synechococcus sp. SB0663_bin_10]MYC50279.1 rod shape-determining protein [Synechococcus sp. SB0662_bin_14]MYG46568.1 rod shape-determining protein [Synechococcus sp. SB0675_bin_6]MYJ59310.1 rod shape-determining protein [Synechococcus sp. SB0672_bin_6]MYK90569.1 rod shape-determining protein [Synechococcus sp. SB0